MKTILISIISIMLLTLSCEKQMTLDEFIYGTWVTEYDGLIEITDGMYNGYHTYSYELDIDSNLIMMQRLDWDEGKYTYIIRWDPSIPDYMEWYFQMPPHVGLYEQFTRF